MPYQGLLVHARQSLEGAAALQSTYWNFLSETSNWTTKVENNPYVQSEISYPVHDFEIDFIC